MVVRYFDEQKCKVRDRFLTMIEVQFDAKSMHEEIIKLFHKYVIPIQNMIGFASDNASVMMGEKGGVRAYFEKPNNNLYVLGCMYLLFITFMFKCCIKNSTTQS